MKTTEHEHPLYRSNKGSIWKPIFFIWENHTHNKEDLLFTVHAQLLAIARCAPLSHSRPFKWHQQRHHACAWCNNQKMPCLPEIGIWLAILMCHCPFEKKNVLDVPLSGRGPQFNILHTWYFKVDCPQMLIVDLGWWCTQVGEVELRWEKVTIGKYLYCFYQHLEIFGRNGHLKK